MAPLDFVAGIDFGGTKVAIASAALDGAILEQAWLDTQPADGAGQAVGRALATAQSVIASAERTTGGHCLAAGVVSPGIVFPDRILLAPNVPGWEDLALESLVRQTLGVGLVAVGTDVKAAGLAELRWGTLANCDPALFLSLGTGVAAAVLVGGRVLTGAHAAAGEIGYSLRGPSDEVAFADGHAPLEELAGGRFIAVRSSRLNGRIMTAAEAFEADDQATRQLVDDTLDELAVHVANWCLLLDPARIAIGGGLTGSGERILAAFERRLKRVVPFAPELGLARFAHDGALRGALALALDLVGAHTPMDTSRVPEEVAR